MPDRPDASDLQVVATGMVTSVGFSAAASCAAARARIDRAAELDYFWLKSDPDTPPERAIGHTVPTVTPGFEGFGRLCALARGALDDLFLHLPVECRRDSRVVCRIALPPADRLAVGVHSVADETRREALTLAASEAAAAVDSRDARFAQFVLSAAEFIQSANVVVHHDHGHCGFAVALHAALDDLRVGRARHALVGAVDSLLDESTLGWLFDTGRLKHDGCPAGLRPGEAAAFVWLAAPGAPVGSSPRPTVTTHVVMGEEPGAYANNGVATGQGLADVLQRSPAAGAPRGTAWLVSDQNGEPYRARDWGTALVRLSAGVLRDRATEVWLPAAAFGDAGAAQGGLAMIWALQAFTRGYAPAQSAVLLSADDGSARTATTVTLLH